ncbi:MAG: 30S ribosome-binding factor RbfA [Candidatus Caenarcaniphilales bacterium]|jgi:ribosome-binding factor A|nr:30S ribosome-binding factor RbfA [Candidatus Caenarcaniphilales bacterium]
MKSYERREKVARAIQKELGAFIQKGGIKDDRLSQFVSIVEVSLNSSLSSARVSFSIFSSADEASKEVERISTQAALNDNSGFLRGIVGRRLNLKYAPRLFFQASDSLSKAVDMVDWIDKIVEEDQSHHEE